jgi:hypothetical protein
VSSPKYIFVWVNFGSRRSFSWVCFSVPFASGDFVGSRFYTSQSGSEVVSAAKLDRERRETAMPAFLVSQRLELPLLEAREKAITRSRDGLSNMASSRSSMISTSYHGID